MNNTKSFFIITCAIMQCLCLFISPTIRANAITNSAMEQQQNTTTAKPTTPTIPLSSVCPSANLLRENNLRWMSPDGWVSYNSSFVTQVTQFTGAHWVGVDVGQIICTYKGLPRLTFPLSLSKALYVKKPSGYKWGKEINGVINCLSFNVLDCVFTPVVHDNSGFNIQSLEKLKTTLPGEQNE